MPERVISWYKNESETSHAGMLAWENTLESYRVLFKVKQTYAL